MSLRGVVIKGIVAAIGLLGTAALVVDWNAIAWHHDRQWTNDAELRGDLVRIEAHVGGYIAAVPIDDFADVRAGQVLYRIDPADYQAAVDQAAAALAVARAQVVEIDAQIALQQARIGTAASTVAETQAAVVRAGQEKQRQDELVDTAGGLRRAWETATADLDRSRATLAGSQTAVASTRQQVEVLLAERERARAAVVQAEAALAFARVQLAYTVITAPADGALGQRRVRLGQYVAPGALLVSFVQANDVWAVSNYREEQMTRVRVGQAADVSVDAYPDLTLHGHVDSIGPVSQGNTQLIPPERATGSFTKVIQRIPVKIVLDPGWERAEIDGQPIGRRLGPGLSVETTIHTDG